MLIAFKSEVAIEHDEIMLAIYAKFLTYKLLLLPKLKNSKLCLPEPFKIVSTENRLSVFT